MTRDLTEAELLERARAWTPIDEDLEGVEPRLAGLILGLRRTFAGNDVPRSEEWHVPEGVECDRDVVFDPDSPAGRISVFYPREAVVRGGHAIPAYVDIHGGGFVYGSHRLNDFFCAHLASHGCVVFNVDYPLATRATFVDVLGHIARALRWIGENGDRWPCRTDRLFLTGDSAGGTLAFYTTLIHANPGFAERLGVDAAPVRVGGTALVSALCDISPYIASEPHTAAGPDDLMAALGPTFFACLGPDRRDDFSLASLVGDWELPPLYLVTSSDDFLQADALALGAELARHGNRFIIDDYFAAPGVSLGHVFPVGFPHLGEGREVVEKIARFAYDQL